MGLKIGLVGLPNVGKSTLFNALSQAGAEAANFPFCTIDPNVGIVPVPDARLTRLSGLANSAKVIPTSIEVVDIAGLVAGASTGEGLGNQFLGHIRETDAICHVVRCFEDSDVIHVNGKVDPLGDIETIDTELILADLDTVTKRIDRARRTAKTGDKKAIDELALVTALHDHLADGNPARTFDMRDAEPTLDKELSLLTRKPVLYAANVGEADLPDGNELTAQVAELAERDGAQMVVICAQVEAELRELDDEERNEFLDSLGLHESGLERLVHAGYRLLNLITYFTVGPKETRAWTVPANSTAPRAAREIHTDFERGFIRAEVIAFTDYDTMGSEQKVKEAGRLRVEGKEYIVKDGDVLHFRFNV